MKKEKKKNTHPIRAIVLAVMVGVCLLLPTSDNYYSHYYLSLIHI